jgi:thiamine monophosphate synthase
MISQFKHIEDLFEEIDKVLDIKLDVYMIGGAVLLYQGIKPATKDIDLILKNKQDFLTLQKAGLRLGISTHGYAEILRALAFQPSYIALGAIFPTTLKTMVTAPQGLGRLRKYAQLLKDYSLVGIGGVDTSNIGSVIDCGVGSAALVRAVIGADDYLSAINTLQSHFKSN